MKRQDLLLIFVVAIFAGIFSLLISNFLISSDSEKNLKAQKVQPITSEFSQPDKNVFNEQAINPTQLIKIGDKPNNNQF